jgi:hypothetical protein
MRNYFIIIVLLITLCSSISQASSFSLEPFPSDSVITLKDENRNRFMQINYDCDEDEYHCNYLIEVYDSSLNLIQSIKSEYGYDAPLLVRGESNLLFRIEDINLDGNKDLVILNYILENGTNASYNFFIFNPDSNKYFFNEKISSLLQCNYSIYPDTRTIQTFTLNNRLGSNFTKNIYEVNDSTFTLLRTIKQFLNPDGEGLIRTLRVYKHDSLVSYKKYVGKWEELEKLLPVN